MCDCRYLLLPFVNCLNCCVQCATRMHDQYNSWRWSSVTDLSEIDFTTNATEVRSRSIHAAVSDKNESEIRRILEEDPDARTAVNSCQETALHLACRLGYLRAVDTLLECGCLPVICTEQGTPIHCTLLALKSGYICVQDAITLIYLLAHKGCNIDAADRREKTALFVAVEQCMVQCVEAILHLGAQLNEPDSNDFTPLYMACIKGELSITRMLLHQVPLVAVDRRDGAGRTPLFATLITVMNNLSYQGMQHPDREGRENYLHTQLAIIELLLKAGANPNAVDCQQRTPVTLSFIILELDYIGTLFTAQGATARTLHAAADDSARATPCTDQEESVYAILIRLLLMFGARAPDNWQHNWQRDVTQYPAWMRVLYEECLDARTHTRYVYHGRPPALRHLCRDTIRDHLATVRRLHRTGLLPLPKPLIHYVQYRYN